MSGTQSVNSRRGWVWFPFRHAARAAVLAATAILLGGCGGAELDSKELGEVIFELPDVPEAKEKYDLPQLEGIEDEAIEPSASQSQAAEPAADATKGTE